MFLVLMFIVVVFAVLENQDANERVRRNYAKLHDEWMAQNEIWKREFESGKKVGPPIPPPPSFI